MTDITIQSTESDAYEVIEAQTGTLVGKIEPTCEGRVLKMRQRMPLTEESLRDILEIVKARTGRSTREIRVAELESALRMLRDAWNAHMATCPGRPDLPTFEQLEAWRNAPSNTATAHPPSPDRGDDDA